MNSSEHWLTWEKFSSKRRNECRNVPRVGQECPCTVGPLLIHRAKSKNNTWYLSSAFIDVFISGHELVLLKSACATYQRCTREYLTSPRVALPGLNRLYVIRKTFSSLFLEKMTSISQKGVHYGHNTFPPWLFVCGKICTSHAQSSSKSRDPKAEVQTLTFI